MTYGQCNFVFESIVHSNSLAQLAEHLASILKLAKIFNNESRFPLWSGIFFSLSGVDVESQKL